MADQRYLEDSVFYKLKDLGDGTFAKVVSIDGGLNLGDITVGSEVEIKNDSGNPIPVEFTATPTVNIGTLPEVEIKNDSGNPISTIEGLSIPAHNYVAFTYSGDNVTTAVYKTGGSSGTIVATLSFTYDGSKVTSITRS